jgi:hypothetical protein
VFFLSMLMSPIFFVQVFNDEDSQRWKKAMDFEFKSLQDDNIWKCIHFPTNHKWISCKWIFKIKYNVDGFMSRHKVRLVTNGFTQVEYWFKIFFFPCCTSGINLNCAYNCNHWRFQSAPNGCLNYISKCKLLMEKIYIFKKTCTQESHYFYACMFKLDTMYKFKFKI